MPQETMIDPRSTRTNQKKIEQDEKELEALMKKTSETQEEEENSEEEESQEEKPEEEESSSQEKEEDLSPEEKTFKKRYSDLRKYMDKKEKEWEKKFASLQSSPEELGYVAPPKSDEDIEQWAKKYPDVAGIVESIARKRAEKIVEETNDRFKSLEEMQEQAVRAKAESKIREKHSDFDTLRDSDEFHNWAEKQPQWVQTALFDNTDDADSVIRVIDLYKLDNGMTTSARKKKAKDAAEEVSTTAKPKVDVEEKNKKFYESRVAKMSDKEFEEKLPDIQKAMSEGNFVYDMSK
jgi:hypothetical protein